jgi:hypothetical protein
MVKHRLMIAIFMVVLLTATIAPISLNADTNQQQANLSESGPWLLFLATPPGETSPYLWGINSDGTGLTQLSEQPVLNFAVNPNPQPYTGGGLVAFVGSATEDLRQELALYFLSLPDGAISAPIPLTSAETGFQPDAESSTETNPQDIAVAIGHRQSLAWSPDGQWLAFVGAMDGSSADLYSYQLADGTIRRLTDGPYQAYQLLWTADSSQIIHSAQFCFLCMGGPYEGSQGIWGAAPDGSSLVTYQGDAPSRFVVWKDATHLLTDSGPRNGCWSDARILDIAANSVEPVDFGCYGPVVYNDDGSHALLYANGDSDLLNEGPGLYFVDIDANQATFFWDDYADFWWDRHEGRFLISGDTGYSAVTDDGILSPDFLVTSQAPSPDGRFVAWFDSAPREQWGGGLWLQTDEGEPEEVLEGGGVALEWSPDSQSFFYDIGQPGLYLVVAETIEAIPLFNQPGLQQDWPYSELGWQATWVGD